MRKDCPRCGRTLDVDLISKTERVICPECSIAYTPADLERLSLLAPEFQEIGCYRIVRYLGSGEFSDVWQAVDKETADAVAIKTPRKKNTNEWKICLLREVRATKRLNHPRIPKVHEVLEDHGRNYAVCDLVRGIALDNWLRDRSLTPTRAARISASLADAMHHAHTAGVVHRDLKPSNILIDEDETLYIMDFGLARCESDDSLDRYEQARYLIADRRTKSKKVRLVGTPSYMSPEQAQGDGYRVDHLTDIYAIGVILYESVTGVRPYRGTTLLRDIKRGRPPRPSKLKRGIPRDLEAVCLKAMAKSASGRYQTALELAEDCSRAIDGRPTEARPSSRWELASSWLWRNLSRQ